MVIANGFITETPSQAFQQVCNRCDGREVRIIPLPTIDTMTYWLSDKGDVFGCQQLKTMCVTKPIRVVSRYKRGCSMRYSVGQGNLAQAFMQNVMYSTFVTGQWEADMEFTFRDGNPYNFQLDNIEPKKPKANTVLLVNLDCLQDVYRSHHLDVAWYIRKFYDIPLDDCRDIASDVFFYLCAFRAYNPGHFIGIWKKTAAHRATDWVKQHARHSESLFWPEEWGEERFGKPDRAVEVADIWGCIRGEKRRQYLRMWSEGETNVEIAEQTGTSYGTVTGEICRAIKELKTIYRKDIAV